MKLEIVIEHVYQEPHSPHYQTIEISADYAALYAFFMALLEIKKDFKVRIAKTQ